MLVRKVVFCLFVILFYIYLSFCSFIWRVSLGILEVDFGFFKEDFFMGKGFWRRGCLVFGVV